MRRIVENANHVPEVVLRLLNILHNKFEDVVFRLHQSRHETVFLVVLNYSAEEQHIEGL